MDTDDLDPGPMRRRAKPRDLSLLSADELREDVVTLRAEIVRIEAEIAKKEGYRAGAEALFRR